MQKHLTISVLLLLCLLLGGCSVLQNLQGAAPADGTQTETTVPPTVVSGEYDFNMANNNGLVGSIQLSGNTTVEHTMVLKKPVTLAQNAKLTIAPGCDFYISTGCTFTNNGTLVVQAPTAEVEGDVDYAIFQIDQGGAFINNATFTIRGGLAFERESVGFRGSRLLLYDETSQITNAGSMVFEPCEEVDLAAECRLEGGSFTNNGILQMNGNGLWINAAFTNAEDATLTVTTALRVDPKARFTNEGTLDGGGLYNGEKGKIPVAKEES